VGRLVARGALSGLIAGLLAALYAFFLVEPTLQRAIDREAARAAAAGQTQSELLTRTAQHAGLFVGLAVVGLTIGVFYGVALWLIHRSRGPLADWAPSVVWRESLRLAAVGYAALHLLAFIRYPANPPGIGGADTINSRTDGWLLAIGFGLFAAALSWRLAALLVERGRPQPWPALAVTAILAVALGIMYAVLPARPDPNDYPAGLLWQFRITSYGSYLILWGGLAVVFTLLTARERSRRRVAVTASGGELQRLP
jgi:hypothetical protein